MKLFFYSLGLFITLVFTSNPITLSFGFKLIPIFYNSFFIILFFNKKILNKVSTSLIFLICLQLIGVLRNNSPNSTIIYNLYLFISQIIFCFYIFSFNYYMIKKEIGFTKLINYNIIIPLTLFGILNYILLALKINDSSSLEIGDAILIKQIFNIDITRVTFPLVSGAVNFGFIIGITIISTILIWHDLSKLFKFIYGVNLLFLMYLLLINDSRATIFTMLLLLIINYFPFLKIKNLFFKFIPILSVFGPLIFILISLTIVNLGLDEYISRNKNDFLTGNSRFIIWLAVLDDIVKFEYWQIFGLGDFGSYSSGVSEAWAGLFLAFDEPLLTTTHNVAFNIFYDLGYIGVFFYVYNISKVFFNPIQSKNTNIPKLLLAFFVIQGITDVPFGFYTFQNNCIFYLIFIVFFYVKNEDIFSTNKSV